MGDASEIRRPEMDVPNPKSTGHGFVESIIDRYGCVESIIDRYGCVESIVDKVFQVDE